MLCCEWISYFMNVERQNGMAPIKTIVGSLISYAIEEIIIWIIVMW